MSVSVKNRVLLVIAALLAVLVAFGGPGEATHEALPSLPPVTPDDVTRIHIGNPVARVALARTAKGEDEQDPDTWRITDPLDYPADAAAIRSLLRAFGAGVRMEAEVDRGHHEEYGLDDQSARLVELYTVGDTPTLSVWVGRTAAGTSSFVRLPGSDAVYRADVGPPARFFQDAAAWRDKWAIEVNRDRVTAVVVERPGDTLRLRRLSAPVDGSSADVGTWTLDGVPFTADSDALAELVKSVTRVRAGEIHHADYPGGFDPPAATVTLTLDDGQTHTVRLGSVAEERSAFLRVDDRPAVFRVAASVRRVLLQPAEGLETRQLFDFARKDLASLALVDGGLTVVLTAEAEGERWVVTQPPNMDVDQAQAAFTVNTLARLRAAGVAADAGFAPSGTRFVLRFTDGHTETLEIGAVEREGHEEPMVRVRATEAPAIYLLPLRQLTGLKRAFGRG